MLSNIFYRSCRCSVSCRSGAAGDNYVIEPTKPSPDAHIPVYKQEKDVLKSRLSTHQASWIRTSDPRHFIANKPTELMIFADGRHVKRGSDYERHYSHNGTATAHYQRVSTGQVRFYAEVTEAQKEVNCKNYLTELESYAEKDAEEENSGERGSDLPPYVHNGQMDSGQQATPQASFP